MTCDVTNSLLHAQVDLWSLTLTKFKIKQHKGQASKEVGQGCDLEKARTLAATWEPMVGITHYKTKFTNDSSTYVLWEWQEWTKFLETISKFVKFCEIYTPFTHDFCTFTIISKWLFKGSKGRMSWSDDLKAISVQVTVK